MVLKVYEESNISAIADKIREKTSGTAKYTTEEMPDGVAEVYDAGKKAEHKAFWGYNQKNGDRTNYDNAYRGEGWVDANFKPEFPIIPTSAYSMFHGACIYDIYNTGQIIDFSKCIDMRNVFYGSYVSRLRVIDLSSATSIQTCFVCRSLISIEKIIFHEGITSTDSAFTNAVVLTDVTIEGVIPISIDIHWSPLTYESITSIISHLSDTATGQTLTLSRAAVNKAFETSEGANDGSTSAEWLALVASKPNWTISLA